MSTKQPGKPVPYKRNNEQVTRDGKPGWRLRAFDRRTGRQPEKNFYGTYEQATVELARWRDELAQAAQPVLVDARNIRVSAYAVQWLADYAWKVKPVGQNPGVLRAETTWKNAKANLSAYILPTLAARRLADLTYKDCYELVAGLRVEGGTQEAAPTTKSTVASFLRVMLADANKAGLLRSNPAAALPTSWGKRSKKLVIPSITQVEKLATAMERIWPGRGDIVRVFAYSGLRWEELAALRWEDVDWSKRSLYVHWTRPSSLRASKDETKTVTSKRYAAILDQASGPLDRLRSFAEQRGSEFVICGARGGPLNYSLWRKYLDRARHDSGVDYTAHGLRHVAASVLIAGGASGIEVCDQMGHSNSSITERVYRHPMSIDRKELAGRMSAAVSSVEVDESSENQDA